ncbi:hypothetical protein LCGC14_0720310, partial [marine sediment metagenome]
MRGGQTSHSGIGGTGTPVGALSTYTASMGKGLREPCSPYREAYVFGAELGVPDANFWNCAALMVEPTNLFDLSTITPNKEVVVALLLLRNLPAGKSYQVNLIWYRDRDNKLLYNGGVRIPDPTGWGHDYWEWYYVYSYIGYVDWEINENGSYHVDLIMDGVLLQTLTFTVTGIVPVVISYTD